MLSDRSTDFDSEVEEKSSYSTKERITCLACCQGFDINNKSEHSESMHNGRRFPYKKSIKREVPKRTQKKTQNTSVDSHLEKAAKYLLQRRQVRIIDIVVRKLGQQAGTLSDIIKLVLVVSLSLVSLSAMYTSRRTENSIIKGMFGLAAVWLLIANIPYTNALHSYKVAKGVQPDVH